MPPTSVFNGVLNAGAPTKWILTIRGTVKHFVTIRALVKNLQAAAVSMRLMCSRQVSRSMMTQSVMTEETAPPALVRPIDESGEVFLGGMVTRA